MTKDLSLHSSLTLNNGIRIINRFFKSAMSEQLGTYKHEPSQALFNLYKTWSLGGTGLIITGNVMIDRQALGEPGNVVLDNQSPLHLFEQWAESAKSSGSQIWMQLNHPGKQSPLHLSKTPVAPSAIPLGAGLEKMFAIPKALSELEIQTIIDQFVKSAALAKQAGFDGVQIHGAHGYLVSQFLSPRHNQRQDQWGGSLENRMRFLMEIYTSMRQVLGSEFPIGIKLNSADFMKGGLSEDESIQVLETLSKSGINLIEVSGGSYENPVLLDGKKQQSTIQREAYFLDFAEKAQKSIETTLVVTGGFRSGQAMLEALQSGATHMIGLARPLAVYPSLPNTLQDNPNHTVNLPTPTTGFKTIDKLTALNITWYEKQLALIAKHKPTRPKMNAWTTIAEAIVRTGVSTFKIRRHN